MKAHPECQYADGCLADQLFGQGWAAPGRPRLSSTRARPCSRRCESIWKYNWAPDVGPQNDAHTPERWFARPGEAGLFTCTWPEGARTSARRPSRYRNEVWTGIEYQVAGHMAWEGMSPRRWPSAAASTSATTPRSTTRGTRSSAATTTPGRWPATASSLACAASSTTARAASSGFAPRLTPGGLPRGLHRRRGLGHAEPAPRGRPPDELNRRALGSRDDDEAAFELPEGRRLAGASARSAIVRRESDRARRKARDGHPAGTVVEAGSTLRVVLRCRT